MLVYDIEVLKTPDEVEGGWNNPEGMGFGIAVAYDFETDLFIFYTAKEKLIHDLKTRKYAVSFNGKKFDSKVLMGNDYEGGEWKEYDILLEVIKSKFENFNIKSVKEAEEKFGAKNIHDGSLGLDILAKSTLGLEIGKIGHGSKAPLLIREGKWAEVFEYCLQDVRLTTQLFSFILQYGYVIDGFGNKIILNREVIKNEYLKQVC